MVWSRLLHPGERTLIIGVCTSASGQLRTLHCLIGSIAGEPSTAPYQQQSPGDAANNYDCQRCSGLNASVPPWACLQYQMAPQQPRGCYQNACLKIVIDALALWSTFFNRPACQIKSSPATSVVIAIAVAMLANGTTLQSAIPGTRNAKMITASAIAPDCQRNLIAVRIPVFPRWQR